MHIDWAGIITAVSSLVIAIATLVTVLKTHDKVKTSNGKTLGTMVEEATATPSGRGIGAIVDDTNNRLPAAPATETSTG